MGVFEIHLHDPSFDLSIGGGDEQPSGFGLLSTNGGSDSTETAEQPPIAGKLVPLLVVLGVVALTVLRNRRRRRRTGG